MDYKELYNEALERAKAGKCIEEIFPELRESEDERIMKEIIEYIKSGEHLECYDKCWIDWLERQKEQKPAGWSEWDVEMIGQIMSSLALDIQRDSKYPEVVAGLKKQYEWIDNLYQRFETNLKHVQSLNETKNELKPTEWSEKDEKHLSWLIEHFSQDLGLYDNLISWLKSLRPQPHWKPSDAQLMALHSVVDDESDTIGNEQLKSLYNDLKKL